MRCWLTLLALAVPRPASAESISGSLATLQAAVQPLGEYLRMGHLDGTTESGVAIDTKGVLSAGGRISDELHDAAFVLPAPLLP